MRFAVSCALAIALATFLIKPIPSPAQTAPDGVTKMHAWFEYQYAREASFLSLSNRHREEVVAITEAFAGDKLSADSAAARINETLSPSERDAVLQVEQSFWVAMDSIYADAYDGRPAKASLGVNGAPIDAGKFLLVLLYSLEASQPATVP